MTTSASLPCEDRRDDFLLRVEELAEAEVLFEQLVRIGSHRGRLSANIHQPRRERNRRMRPPS